MMIKAIHVTNTKDLKNKNKMDKRKSFSSNVGCLWNE